MFLRQHQAISRAHRTDGRVIASRVETRMEWDEKARKYDTSYEAVIHYEYSVRGKTYQGERVGAVVQPGGRDDTQRLVARYAPESVCTVYVDPNRPTEAFLLADYRLMPYIIALLGMPMVALIPAAGTGALRAEGQAPATRRNRSLGWTATSLLWHAAGIAFLCHWLFVCRQPATAGIILPLLAYHALGIAPAVAARRAIEAWIERGNTSTTFPRHFVPRWE